MTAARPVVEQAPRTLDEVEAIVDPIARARAAVLYLDRLEERQVAALRVRNAAIRAARPLRAPEVAQRVGVTVAVVKHARRTRGQR